MWTDSLLVALAVVACAASIANESWALSAIACACTAGLVWVVAWPWRAEKRCAEAASWSQVPPPPFDPAGPWPYPSGWYAVALAGDVQSSAVIPARVGAVELVVWRGPGGPVVSSAYCPHLGAHFGAGGAVEDGCLQCPFHGWKFNSAGAVHSTPAGGPLPPAKLLTWPCVERNGLVLVWVPAAAHLPQHRALGARQACPVRDVKPAWQVPEVQGFGPGATWHGVVSHEVAAYIGDIPENGADAAHLHAVHAPFLVRALQGWLRHEWYARWRGPVYAGQPHISKVWIEEHVSVSARAPGCPCGAARRASAAGHEPALAREPSSQWDARLSAVDSAGSARMIGPAGDGGPTLTRSHGGRLPLGSVYADTTQVGPGLVFIRVSTPLGPLCVAEMVTPVGPRRQLVRHAVWTPPGAHTPRCFARVFMAGLARQFERDWPIWNHKVHLRAPTLTKADARILPFRRWWSQFQPAELTAADVQLHSTPLDW